MKSHDSKRIISAPACQFWRAFVYVMPVHENHIVKRAGVAGIALRARGVNMYAEAEPVARWRALVMAVSWQNPANSSESV